MTAKKVREHSLPYYLTDIGSSLNSIPRLTSGANTDYVTILSKPIKENFIIYLWREN